MYPWFFGLGCSCPWTFLFDWFTEVWHIAVSRVRVWCKVKNFILPNRWKVHVLIIRYDPERKTSVCLLPFKKKKDTMLYFYAIFCFFYLCLYIRYILKQRAELSDFIFLSKVYLLAPFPQIPRSRCIRESGIKLSSEFFAGRPFAAFRRFVSMRLILIFWDSFNQNFLHFSLCFGGRLGSRSTLLGGEWHPSVQSTGLCATEMG